MCDFPSWYETEDGKILFLTDKDVREHGLEGDDSIGHHAICKVFGTAHPMPCAKAGEGFPCPPEVAAAIRADKMRKMMESGGYSEVHVTADGLRHRDGDEPAIIYADGGKHWYRNGKFHRDGDEPAVIYADGEKHWYRNGLRHRDGDEPAIIYADGDKHWYRNGLLHRDGDEPAVIYADGGKYWYRNSKLIRSE